MEKNVEQEVIRRILERYGFTPGFSEQKSYIHAIEESGFLKLIFRVTLDSGKMLVIKIVHEDEDSEKERRKIQNQSSFSEAMRSYGIKTPARHRSGEAYCIDFSYQGLPCLITVEDWCGEEVRWITADLASRIGKLMARMHTISHENGCRIGHGTLFCAAYWNDVDAYPDFCEITRDGSLDQTVVRAIKSLHDKKLGRIRAVWDTLPKAAVQGDISINNLVDGSDGLTVFDYNNAGDEVLVSDLVMEGLLTAYEMDLPEGAGPEFREQLFPAFLSGYLSVRSLSEAECAAAWEIYTLYHGLWFTRILYNVDSLQQLVKNGDYEAANDLLRQMLVDMMQTDDGRFRGEGIQALSGKCGAGG